MKIFTGKVVSTKMAKTATVEVERVVIHPVYKKRFKRVKRYHVHDEVGVTVGQVVRFIATKPISKLKRWSLLEVGAVDSTEKNTDATRKETKAKKSTKTIKKTVKKTATKKAKS